MSAQLPRHAARLRALLSGSLARPGVTHRDAFMPSARQRLIARQTARDLLHVARHGLPELVFTVAPSLSQHAARRTRGLAVTVVQHLVIAGMLARTWPIANGPSRTARYRWIDHLGTALAVQFFEATLPTRRTSPCRREEKFVSRSAIQYRA